MCTKESERGLIITKTQSFDNGEIAVFCNFAKIIKEAKGLKYSQQPKSRKKGLAFVSG